MPDTSVSGMRRVTGLGAEGMESGFLAGAFVYTVACVTMTLTPCEGPTGTPYTVTPGLDADSDGLGRVPLRLR